MTRISLTSPNNTLPGNPLIFVVHTHGCSPKQTFSFHLRIFYPPPPIPAATYSWVTYSLHPTASAARLSHRGFPLSLSLISSPHNATAKQCMLTSFQVLRQEICRVIFPWLKAHPWLWCHLPYIIKICRIHSDRQIYCRGGVWVPNLALYQWYHSEWDCLVEKLRNMPVHFMTCTQLKKNLLISLRKMQGPMNAIIIYPNAPLQTSNGPCVSAPDKNPGFSVPGISASHWSRYNSM